MWEGQRPREKQFELIRMEKNCLKIKFLGGIFWGHQGPTRRDIPEPGPGPSRTETFCKVLFFSVAIDRQWPVCPAVCAGTFQDQKNFMQENIGLIFRSRISADRKRGQRKGATSKMSKSVEKCQKFFDTFRHFSRRAKNVRNRQKVSQIFSTLFDNFRAAPFFRPLLGGSEN